VCPGVCRPPEAPGFAQWELGGLPADQAAALDRSSSDLARQQLVFVDCEHVIGLRGPTPVLLQVGLTGGLVPQGRVLRGPLSRVLDSWPVGVALYPLDPVWVISSGASREPPHRLEKPSSVVASCPDRVGFSHADCSGEDKHAREGDECAQPEAQERQDRAHRRRSRTCPSARSRRREPGERRRARAAPGPPPAWRQATRSTVN